MVIRIGCPLYNRFFDVRRIVFHARSLPSVYLCNEYSSRTNRASVVRRSRKRRMENERNILQLERSSRYRRAHREYFILIDSIIVARHTNEQTTRQTLQAQRVYGKGKWMHFVQKQTQKEALLVAVIEITFPCVSHALELLAIHFTT